jgi:hypothetical protein
MLDQFTEEYLRVIAGRGAFEALGHAHAQSVIRLPRRLYLKRDDICRPSIDSLTHFREQARLFEMVDYYAHRLFESLHAPIASR